MPNFEHHIIVGHVGGDVTLRYTQSGVAVASFSLAVNDRRNKDAPPTWYRVTCWRQLAEFANEYVRKGAPLLVSGGRLVQSEWQTDAGEKRTSLELTADAVTLLGSTVSLYFDRALTQFHDLKRVEMNLAHA